MKSAKWMDTLRRADDRGEDLMALGEALGKDTEISEEAFWGVILDLSKECFASYIATILDSSIEYRRCPPMDYWQELILHASDPEVGASLLRALLPWIDITELLEVLIESASECESYQSRVAYMTWYAVCGGSFCLHVQEYVDMKHAMDCSRLKHSIEDAIQKFHQQVDRDLLTETMKSL